MLKCRQKVFLVQIALKITNIYLLIVRNVIVTYCKLVMTVVINLIVHAQIVIIQV